MYGLEKFKQGTILFCWKKLMQERLLILRTSESSFNLRAPRASPSTNERQRMAHGHPTNSTGLTARWHPLSSFSTCCFPLVMFITWMR